MSALGSKAQLALGAAVGILLVLPSASLGSAGCPNEQFRTGPAANLPDCRAYEQVSPTDKNGGNVDGGLVLETEPAPEQSARNGESVTFASQTAFTGVDPLGAMASSQYIAVRNALGWHTTAITPPQTLPFGKLNASGGNLQESLYQGFTEDLRYGYLDAAEPSPVAGAPAGYYNPYVRDDASGSYSLLSNVTPPTLSNVVPTCCRGFVAEYAGMTEDGSHVIFAANDALTPEATPGVTNLYESVNGHVELVSVMPNGEPDTKGQERVEEGGHLAFGSKVEQSEQGAFWNFGHVLSTDGRRAIWTGSNQNVYLHELTPEGAKTIDVSASQRTGGGETTYAHYWTASTDGSIIYFSSCNRLTNSSTAVEGECISGGTFPGHSHGQDLYRYEVGSGKLTDVSMDSSPGETANFQGVLGASDDGSYVYFAANGVLAEGAAAGAENIYVWHNGAVALVATLDPRNFGETVAWDQSLKEKSSRVSPNGRYLAFNAIDSLTGYDNAPSNAGQCYGGNEVGYEFWSALTHNGELCSEVFVYDAASQSLACASCDPRGFPATGNSVVPPSINALQPSFGWASSTIQQRYLNDSGRLFFDSKAALVSQDTNGKEDVYEYAPAGINGCLGSKSCLSLISSGTGAQASQFLDADPSGDNVFFVTYDKLVPRDGDEEGDLYDARVGGGFADVSTPPCSGEACRPAVSSAPSIYGAPTSQAFNGGGNVVVQAKAVKSKPKPKLKRTKRKKRKKARKSRAHSPREQHGNKGVR